MKKNNLIIFLLIIFLLLIPIVISFGKAGEYTLIVSASNKKEEWGVGFYSFVAINCPNFVCEETENKVNCPHDCLFRRDLSVNFIGGNLLVVNKSNSIEIEVTNLGNIDAVNATLSLYKDNLLRVKSREERVNSEEEFELIQSRSLDSIPPGESIIVNIDFTPIELGNHYLTASVEYKGDIDKSNNEYNFWIRALKPDADAVARIFHIENVEVGEHTFITIEIENLGLKDLNDITVDLFIDDELYNRSVVKKIIGGEFYDITYNWTPQENGEHIIRLNVSSEDDSFKENNVFEMSAWAYRIINTTFEIKNSNGEFTERLLAIENVLEEFINSSTNLTIIDYAGLSYYLNFDENGNIIGFIFEGLNIKEKMEAISDLIIKNITDQEKIFYLVYANEFDWNAKKMDFAFEYHNKSIASWYSPSTRLYECDEWDFNNSVCNTKWRLSNATLNISESGVLFDIVENVNAKTFAFGENDSDGDKIPDRLDTDNDNDGIEDSKDRLFYTPGCISDALGNIDLLINNDANLSKIFNKTETLTLRQGSKQIVQTIFDFKNKKLDCRDIKIQRQSSDSHRGYIIVSGLDIGNEKKTLFIDKIISNVSQVCVKDKEIKNISEINLACDGGGELLLNCNNNVTNGYKCEDIVNLYKVSGLKNSGVVEMESCIESWQCTGWSDCTNELKKRNCTEVNSCGTELHKPEINKTCNIKDKTKKVSRRISITGTLFDYDTSQDDSRTFDLRTIDEIVIKFKNKNYKFHIQRLGSESIDFKIESRFLSLGVNQKVTVDLDGDNIDDIGILFEKGRFNRATFTLSQVSSVVETQVVRLTKEKKPEVGIGAEPIKQKVDTERKEESAEEVEKGFNLLILLIPISIFIVLGGSVLVFKYTKDKSPKKKYSVSGGHKQDIMARNKIRLKLYISSMLNQGFPEKEIRYKLNQSNWSKNIVDEAFNEFRRK